MTCFIKTHFIKKSFFFFVFFLFFKTAISFSSCESLFYSNVFNPRIQKILTSDLIKTFFFQNPSQIQSLSETFFSLKIPSKILQPLSEKTLHESFFQNLPHFEAHTSQYQTLFLDQIQSIAQKSQMISQITEWIQKNLPKNKKNTQKIISFLYQNLAFSLKLLSKIKTILKDPPMDFFLHMQPLSSETYQQFSHFKQTDSSPSPSSSSQIDTLDMLLQAIEHASDQIAQFYTQNILPSTVPTSVFSHTKDILPFLKLLIQAPSQNVINYFKTIAQTPFYDSLLKKLLNTSPGWIAKHLSALPLKKERALKISHHLLKYYFSSFLENFQTYTFLSETELLNLFKQKAQADPFSLAQVITKILPALSKNTASKILMILAKKAPKNLLKHLQLIDASPKRDLILKTLAHRHPVLFLKKFQSSIFHIQIEDLPTFLAKRLFQTAPKILLKNISVFNHLSQEDQILLLNDFFTEKPILLFEEVFKMNFQSEEEKKEFLKWKNQLSHEEKNDFLKLLSQITFFKKDFIPLIFFFQKTWLLSSHVLPLPLIQKIISYTLWQSLSLHLPFHPSSLEKIKPLLSKLHLTSQDPLINSFYLNDNTIRVFLPFLLECIVLKKLFSPNWTPPETISELLSSFFNITPNLLSENIWNKKNQEKLFISLFKILLYSFQKGVPFSFWKKLSIDSKLFKKKNKKKLLQFLETFFYAQALSKFSKKSLSFTSLHINSTHIHKNKLILEIKALKHFAENMHLFLSERKLQALQKEWGSLEIFLILAFRFETEKPIWHVETPILFRILEATSNGNFKKLKYEGVLENKQDMEKAKKQLALLSKEQKTIWEKNQSFLWMTPEKTLSQKELSWFEKNLLQPLFSYFSEVPNFSTSDPNDLPSWIHTLFPIKQDPVHILQNIMQTERISDLKIRNTLFKLLTSRKNIQRKKEILTFLIRIFKNHTPRKGDKIGFLKKYPAFTPLGDKTDLLNTLSEALSFLKNVEESSPSFQLVLTVFEDHPKLLLETGALVPSQYSCLHYKNAFAIYPHVLLAYVLDAPVKLLLSFVLEKNHFTHIEDFHAVHTAIKSHQALKLYFEGAKHILHITFQNGKTIQTLPLTHAQLRNIVEIGEAGDKQIGLFLEHSYYKNQNLFLIKNHQDFLKNLASRLQATTTWTKLLLPSSRNPLGIYSDAAKGIQMQEYFVYFKNTLFKD